GAERPLLPVRQSPALHRQGDVSRRVEPQVLVDRGAAEHLDGGRLQERREHRSRRRQGILLGRVDGVPDGNQHQDGPRHRDVHPELGKPGDVEQLIREAGRRGIRVLLDLVPNHTSDRHPWFVDAKSSRSSQRRDWYVWADGRPDGSPPNNWRSSFGGPAWSFDDATGQWYLHHFLPSQPDLNWWSPAVRESLDAILRHWFDRGVAGMRIDVCNMIVKDRELRDNPPATDDDPAFLRMLGQRQVYNSGRPALHDVLRRWRRIANAYAR